MHTASSSTLPPSIVARRLAGARAPGPPGEVPFLEALRRGEPGALAALLARAAPVVRRTVDRYLGMRDRDCEDVAQGAMVEIARSVSKFRGDCPLEAWCARVTAFVVCKHIRRRRTERRIFAPLGPETEELGSDMSGRGPILRSSLARVRLHLQTMKVDMARALLLHDVYGCDLVEIAEITGVSVAAAQTRLSRGKRDLRKRLAGDPELAGRLEDVGAYP